MLPVLTWSRATQRRIPIALFYYSVPMFSFRNNFGLPLTLLDVYPSVRILCLDWPRFSELKLLQEYQVRPLAHESFQVLTDVCQKGFLRLCLGFPSMEPNRPV